MNHFDKKLLKEALLEAQIRDFSLFPSEEELDSQFTFSPEFQNYIQKLSILANKKEHKFIYIGLHPIRKIVAVIIILIILSAPVTVPAITRGIIRIVQMLSTDRIDVHLDIPTEQIDILPTRINYYCEPTWLPDGYQKQEQNQDIKHSLITYTAQDQKPIYFIQFILTEKGVSLDSDDSIVKEVLIQDTYSGIYSIKGDLSTLSWSDGYYQYQLIGSLDENNLMKISNSVK